MISVIIPLYNKGNLISRTLNSVLTQSYTDFEIVVVDDGSTDDSASYVLSMHDERVRYHYKKNGGVSSARNEGIKLAAGEWLFFLDADDILLPGSLEMFQIMMKKYASARLYTGYTQWIQNGVTIQEDHNSQIWIKHSCHPFLSMWLNLFYPHPGAMLIHRSLINQCGVFNEQICYFEDYEFTLRMLKYTSVVYTNKAIMCYYQKEGGLSTASHKIEKEMAFYIPNSLDKCSFWNKALLYENVEFCKSSYDKQSEEFRYYQEMQNKRFGFVHPILHSLRQRLLNHHIL